MVGNVADGEEGGREDGQTDGLGFGYAGPKVASG